MSGLLARPSARNVPSILEPFKNALRITWCVFAEWAGSAPRAPRERCTLVAVPEPSQMSERARPLPALLSGALCLFVASTGLLLLPLPRRDRRIKVRTRDLLVPPFMAENESLEDSHDVFVSGV